MKNENEFEYVLHGKERQTLWGYENPEFNESKNGVTLDAFVTEESVVPYRYSEGKTFWLKDKGSTRLCMNYVFKLYGKIERQEEQMKLVGAFTHALPHDWEKHHVAYRSLGDEVYSKGALRTFIYRVYENTDECSEHPEMLCGTPCGMYHCPVCMEMVIAGVPHPSKEHVREYHESEMQADKMIGVQEMKERTVAPEDETVQRVVSAGDGSRAIPMIAVGEYSDEPVTIAGVDGIVIKDSAWTPGGEEQMQNRAARKFKERAEQIEGRGESIFKKVEGTRLQESVMNAVASLKTYFNLEAGWDMDGEMPEPDKAGINFALKFLEQMLILNRQESVTDKINAPLTQLDHEGIPSLFWTSTMVEAQRGKSDYISFAFYGDGEIVLYWRTADGSSHSSGKITHQSPDMRKAFALIQEFGGNQHV